MRRTEFDSPVKIAVGKPRLHRSVRTIAEAADCLRNESWPTRNKPFSRIAARALDAAKTGHVTPAEAREAFADAALEAHLLVLRQTKH
jgi:hypothetical protein